MFGSVGSSVISEENTAANHSRMLGIAEAYLIMIRAVAGNPDADPVKALPKVAELARRGLIQTGWKDVSND